MNKTLDTCINVALGTIFPLTVKGVQIARMERENERLTGQPASNVAIAYGVFADTVTYGLYALGAWQLHNLFSYSGEYAMSQKVATEQFVGEAILGSTALMRAGCGAALGSIYRDTKKGVEENKRERIGRGTLS